MTATSFADLMASVSALDDAYQVVLPPDWLQGRTAFGGLTAALCWQATQRDADDLPPLRSAQISFVGPAGGTLRIKPDLLRRGKSSAFYGVDLFGDDKLAARAMFCFGASRESKLDLVDYPAPDVPHWDACEGFFRPVAEHPATPQHFSQHFESRMAGGARPVTPGAKPEFLIWLRHGDATLPDNLSPLIALADALPPAAIVAFPPERKPISTMTWSIEVLSDTPKSASGWWLVQSVAKTAQQGYSAQDMSVWNDQGQPVLMMSQTVAIFA
ncbi:MAG: thioesterase family protein [Alphaproteobacteria bacterium]